MQILLATFVGGCDLLRTALLTQQGLQNLAACTHCANKDPGYLPAKRMIAS